MSRPGSSSSSASNHVYKPKLDQDPLNDDDLSELLSVVSSCQSSSQSEASPEFTNNVRNIQGSSRTFSASNQIYLLPLDEGEFRRLDKQHSLLRVGMTGLFPTATRNLISSILTQYKGTDATVLDVGCGSGQWAHDLVGEYDNVRLVTIDQLPQMEDPLPPNLTFKIHDVNEGLEPFYGGFDVVHVRCVASGVKSYRKLLQETAKCLKPGGIAIFVEGDFDLVTEDQKTIQEPASDANPNGSWLQRWVQAVRMAQVKRCQITDSDDCPETLDKGLWQFEAYDPQSCGVESVFTPTSPWPTGIMEEENIHFKVAGVLMRQNLKLFLEATEQMLIEDGNDREEVAIWKVKVRAEMEDDTLRTWFRWRIAWGCAPKAPSNTPQSSNNANRRPQMIYGESSRAARHALLSKVMHFKHQQSHVYNRRQALANLAKREATPFSTRGRF